jgi:hypothetical protein
LNHFDKLRMLVFAKSLFLKVRWLREDEIAWYEGEVRQYLAESDMYEILYDDGTRVTESLAMRYWRPLQRLNAPESKQPITN